MCGSFPVWVSSDVHWQGPSMLACWRQLLWSFVAQGSIVFSGVVMFASLFVSAFSDGTIYVCLHGHAQVIRYTVKYRLSWVRRCFSTLLATGVLRRALAGSNDVGFKDAVSLARVSLGSWSMAGTVIFVLTYILDAVSSIFARDCHRLRRAELFVH